MESTMRTRAARLDAAATMCSTQVSAMSRVVAASNPRRRPRSATCFRDSSPAAYSTGPRVCRAAAACSISVDFPMPGSPPIRVTEPGTRPPPSTRSSSVEPVVSRGCSRTASAANEEETSVRDVLPDRAGLRGLAAETSASKLFHSPQPAHCPCHLGEDAPQFWQINTSLDFAIGFLSVGFVTLALQIVQLDHLYCRASRFG